MFLSKKVYKIKKSRGSGSAFEVGIAHKMLFSHATDHPSCHCSGPNFQSDGM